MSSPVPSTRLRSSAAKYSSSSAVFICLKSLRIQRSKASVLFVIVGDP